MNEETFLLVEAYVLGRMTPEERTAFERRLSSDAELRAHVDTMMKLQKGILAAGRDQMRKEVFPSRQIPFMIRLTEKRVLAIAATLIFAAIAYVFLIPDQGEKLYEAYYNPADTVYLRQSRGIDDDYTLKEKALAEYKASRYDVALDLLSKIEAEDEESFLMQGLAFLEIGDWKEAEKKLRLAMNGSPRNAATASWYLAMVYVHQKDFTAAQQLLKPLSEKPSPYQAEAAKLLEELTK